MRRPEADKPIALMWLAYMMLPDSRDVDSIDFVVLELPKYVLSEYPGGRIPGPLHPTTSWMHDCGP